MGARSPSGPKKRRERGDDGISWDKTNKYYEGSISLGFDGDGKRLRRRVRAKTKTEVKEKLDAIDEEIKDGIQTPAAYTVRAVRRGLARLTGTGPVHRGRLPGSGREVDLPGDRRNEAEGLQGHSTPTASSGDAAQELSKASLVKIKSTLIQVDPAGPEVRPHRPERRRSWSTCPRASRATRHEP